MNNQSLNKVYSAKAGAVWALAAVASFHVAYAIPALSAAIFLFLFCLFQLRYLDTTRKCFYLGFVIGVGIYAPHLAFFWTLFDQAAILLWIILAFWIAMFLLLASAVTKRFGSLTAAALLPFLWLGLEYFRSELYYLRFSWMNVGFAFNGGVSSYLGFLGVYGIGFALAVLAACFSRWTAIRGLVASGVVVLALLAVENTRRATNPATTKVNVAGIQMEFPDEDDVLRGLDSILKKHPEAKLLILSEYTFGGTVPTSVLDWCRTNQRYLIAGGREPAGADFYNTAYVVGPEGNIVFQQGKSVPIQFFKDGLPAPEQKLWNSPWGKIGICVCYDLSYRRVVDELVRQGAEAIIIPTMDVVTWGEAQHKLHARVAPMRAAEYEIPLYRVCSSGISQFVAPGGAVLSTAPFPGDKEILSGHLNLPKPGRLPLDYWLGPFAVGLCVLTIVALAFKRRTAKETRSGLVESTPAEASSK